MKWAHIGIAIWIWKWTAEWKDILQGKDINKAVSDRHSRRHHHWYV